MPGYFRGFQRPNLKYLAGFDSLLSSEALPGALPKFQNSPQKAPFKLYPELLSGTSFTTSRANNRYVWCYRIRPSVTHTFENYKLVPTPLYSNSGANVNSLLDVSGSPNGSAPLSLWTAAPSESDYSLPPTPFRWPPLNLSDFRRDFVSSLVTVASTGSHRGQTGGSSLLYNCNASMDPARDFENGANPSQVDRSDDEKLAGLTSQDSSSSMSNNYFTNLDAEMLIIPQEGILEIRTELGDMIVEPLEVALLPRGMKFQVNLVQFDRDGKFLRPSNGWKGYVCENFGQNFCLPELGPIGITSGLANPRHFLAPTAAFQDTEFAREDPSNNSATPMKLTIRFSGKSWVGDLKYSPLDVVAWHGNLHPVKYDLRLFTVINSVSHDHPDPSIFTVLTSPSETPGTGNLDFVVFFPRYVVQMNTFRPPWFHRNTMSELMGLISGVYDGKLGGFVPGGVSIHNRFISHGPDCGAYMKAIEEDTSEPARISGMLAFMLESKLVWEPSHFALNGKLGDGNAWLESGYAKCWEDLPRRFNPASSLEAATQQLPNDLFKN